MGISKTEINLTRLIAAAPNQPNQAKLVHYVATMREMLEQLGEERTPDGLPRLSKTKINEYSEKIEAIASKLATPVTDDSQDSMELISGSSAKESAPNTDQDIPIPTSPVLRRRFVSTVFQDNADKANLTDTSAPVKLDGAAKAHIEKHRKLQEDLTDEMVGLARQLKERSLLMNQSVKNTEKILDATEKAVEQSLASTGRANVRAVEIYSKSSKTTCLTWLLMFVMTCIFIMVVLLIRVT